MASLSTETAAQDVRNAMSILLAVHGMTRNPQASGFHLDPADYDAVMARLWSAVHKLEA